MEKHATGIPGFDIISDGGLPHGRVTLTFKMRGSMHDKDIREFVIDDEGMHIKGTFQGTTGILAGRLSAVDGTRPPGGATEE